MCSVIILVAGTVAAKVGLLIVVVDGVVTGIIGQAVVAMQSL